MAPIPEKYAMLLQGAAVQLQETLHAENEDNKKLVQKGLLLFRQGLVSQMKLDSGNVLASVQDVTQANVKLALSNMENSSCSCPGEGICRHQLAVFFHAYSNIGSVAGWVEQWRQPQKEKELAGKWGLKRAKDLLKSAGKVIPEYDGWIDSFQESFDSIMKGQGDPKPYVVSELFHVYEKRLAAAAPLPQEWKTLYELVGYLYSFKRLSELSVELGHSEPVINLHYRFLFHYLLDDAEDAIGKLSVHTLPFAFDEFMEKLKDDSLALLTDESVLEYERVQFYRTLWADLFKNSSWRQEERTRLEGLAKINGSLSVSIGYLHLLILGLRDDPAIGLLNSLNDSVTPYLLYWLERFDSQKDWKRMAPFADLFVQRLNGYLTILDDYNACIDFTELAIKMIAPFCMETNRLDLFERALIQALPYSYRDYDYFLYKRGSFEKWAELQAYVGFDLSVLPDDRIKELQTQDPSVLLPLYHQTIQSHIDSKNRGDYKEAVRLLKKLRTLYKKLKRQDDWAVFIDMLTERTKRLRAFQEECKRGKLIHA